MSDSVIHQMRTSAAASILLHAQALAELEPSSLHSMLCLLHYSCHSSDLDGFWEALGRLDAPADSLLQALNTHQLIELEQLVHQAWNNMPDQGSKQALRHLYQLLTAHFFITYAQDTPYDSAA